MLIQLRTGRTGLRHFLNKVQVPGYESGQCSCGMGLETPRHVLLHCTLEAERREALKGRQGGQLDFASLLDTPKGAPIASKWMIRSGRLPQFQLAETLLYGGASERGRAGRRGQLPRTLNKLSAKVRR